MEIRIYIIVFFCCSVWSNAQIVWENENKRIETITVTDTLQLNTNILLPEKFKVIDENGKLIPSVLYEVDYTSAKVVFSPLLRGSKLSISYYVHPYLQQKEIHAKDNSLIIKSNEKNNYYDLNPKKEKAKQELFSGLESRGSLVRGIRFGNNQNASTQSSLDLQLSGKLSEEITINAAISDNNVPIEADGYTQQLQEFDKVYVELANKNSKVRAGHIDLEQRDDFFGNFSQKVTGLQLSTNLVSERSTTYIQAAASLSRGEFISKKFNGEDGNQGPYRLSGKYNELFIIILSGSERIFIDGILLERGEDKDYVINYNTGEITFTNRRQITANARITAEYLYASRNYNQFLFYGGIKNESERFKISTHFYTNGDVKNNPINSDLSQEDKRILSEAGNDKDKMITTSAERTEYDADKILYRKLIHNGTEIFEYSTEETDELYQLSFTYMGENKGNYRTINLGQNGRVFEYVEAIAGIPQGNYEPIRQLVAPKRLRMYTLNALYKLKNKGVLGFDFAFSNQDLNLFSNIDDKENNGFANRINFDKEFAHRNWQFTPRVEFSFIHKNFNAIENIRNIEFARDFNLKNEFAEVNQMYWQLSLKSKYRQLLYFDYHFDYLDNSKYYKGIKNTLGASLRGRKNRAELSTSFLHTDDVEVKSDYLRYDLGLKRALWKNIWLGTKYEGENNEVKDKLSKKLSTLSFRWSQISGVLELGDSTRMNLALTYYHRRDDSIRLGNRTRISQTNGWMIDSKLINQKEHRLSLALHYRRVNYEYEKTQKEDYITGNLKWYKSFLNNGLVLNAYYELGSGVEPQREFQYVKVSDGMGIYKWTDYNADGIEQLDEFEVAEFKDQANYIRVYTNTIEYVRTNKNALSLSLRIRPKELFALKDKFWNRWLLTTHLQMNNSLRKGANALEWNPFVKSTDLLAKTQNISTSLNYNQGSQYRWSAIFNYVHQENQNFVYTGNEYREEDKYALNLKYKTTDSFFILIDTEHSIINSDSDLFSTRRYKIESWKVKPKLEYQLGERLNTSLRYIYQNKTNVSGIERLNQSDLGTDIQWNDGSKSSLVGSFSFIQNNFKGMAESVVGNQMMEGLRAGKNFVWQLIIQRQITSFLSFNITYDGRKTEVDKAIHTGSVQIQARF